MRDASFEYPCVYACVCSSTVGLVFAHHLGIPLHIFLSISWKFLVRLNYASIVVFLLLLLLLIPSVHVYTSNSIISKAYETQFRQQNTKKSTDLQDQNNQTSRMSYFFHL
jgi:hypothetical protein